MNIEQLALLGIIVFGFMAVVNVFNSIRSYKRHNRMKPMRVRRLIGGKESALALAESLVNDVISKHKDAAANARQTGRLPPDLETTLEELRTYYLGRVEPIHKTLFNEAVDKLILKRDTSNTKRDQ